MKTDYKFWYIKRDDDGFITQATIRFYEGEVTTENEKGVPVTRYRRTKRLETFDDLQHLKKDGIVKGLKEVNGKVAVFYNQENFGQIKTDDELRDFLNKELEKDKSREPIEEQKVK